MTDLDPARKLAHRTTRRCSMFTGCTPSMFNRYLGRRQRRLSATRTLRAPTAPVDVDLSRMPPVAIHASGDELLLAASG